MSPDLMRSRHRDVKHPIDDGQVPGTVQGSFQQRPAGGTIAVLLTRTRQGGHLLLSRLTVSRR